MSKLLLSPQERTKKLIKTNADVLAEIVEETSLILEKLLSPEGFTCNDVTELVKYAEALIIAESGLRRFNDDTKELNEKLKRILRDIKDKLKDKLKENDGPQ